MPRPGFEPTASGFLKDPDQLDRSVTHLIYLYTLYFVGRTAIHESLKGKYKRLEKCVIFEDLYEINRIAK